MSLEELVHILQPVGETKLISSYVDDEIENTPQSNEEDLSPNEKSREGTARTANLSVPKELWRLIDALWSGNALKERDLFNTKSDPQEVFK